MYSFVLDLKTKNMYIFFRCRVFRKCKGLFKYCIINFGVVTYRQYGHICEGSKSCQGPYIKSAVVVLKKWQNFSLLTSWKLILRHRGLEPHSFLRLPQSFGLQTLWEFITVCGSESYHENIWSVVSVTWLCELLNNGALQIGFVFVVFHVLCLFSLVTLFITFLCIFNCIYF